MGYLQGTPQVSSSQVGILKGGLDRPHTNALALRKPYLRHAEPLATHLRDAMPKILSPTEAPRTIRVLGIEGLGSSGSTPRLLGLLGAFWALGARVWDLSMGVQVPVGWP